MFEFKCSTGKLYGQTGVYRWYYIDKNNVEKTIYVGEVLGRQWKESQSHYR